MNALVLQTNMFIRNAGVHQQQILKLYNEQHKPNHTHTHTQAHIREYSHVMLYSQMTQNGASNNLHKASFSKRILSNVYGGSVKLRFRFRRPH